MQPNSTTSNPEMSPRHWALLADIRMRLSARRFLGLEYPKQVGPWHRDEYAIRARRGK